MNSKNAILITIFSIFLSCFGSSLYAQTDFVVPNDIEALGTLKVTGGDLNIYDEATLAAESITDGAFPDSTNWSGTGDWSDTIAGNTTYTHSAGSGNLNQANAQLAIAGKNNRQYKFTYTVSAVTNVGANVLTITSDFAATAVTLDISSAGTRSIIFKSSSTADAEDLVFSATSDTASDTFTLDDLTLKEITGGNVLVAGKITGGGSSGVTVDGDGNIVVDGSGPHAIGVASQGVTQFRIGGTFISDGSSTIGRLVVVGSTLTGASGDTTRLSGFELAPAITTQAATESITDITSFLINEPSITDNLTGGGLITAASTLLITGAPDEGVDNYAFLVKAGETRFGAVGTNDGHVHILSPATGTRAFVVEMPSGASVNAQEWHLDGVAVALLNLDADESILDLQPRDLGNNIRGPRLQIGNNTNGTQASAAFIQMTDLGGTAYKIHPDNAGLLRIGTTIPVGTADTTNGVVGDQSSWHETKDFIPTLLTPAKALARIVGTDIFDFTYKDLRYPETFIGVVGIERSDWFLKDRGKALNTISLHGTEIQAIKALNEKILRLEKVVEELSQN